MATETAQMKGLLTYVLAFLLLSQATLNAANYTINGSSVYWTQNGRTITTTPHTAFSYYGWFEQYVNLTSTNPTSVKVNISFVFDAPIEQGKAFYWANYSHTQEIPIYQNQTLGNGTNITFISGYQNVSSSYFDWLDISAGFDKTTIGQKTIFTRYNVQVNNGDNHQLFFRYKTKGSGKYDIVAHAGTPQQVASGQAQTYVWLDPFYNYTNATETTIIDGGQNYTILTYNQNGTLNLSQAINATILVIGGGGGGGRDIYSGVRAAGGGGAGGYVYVANQNISAGIYSVIVGLGGTGGINSDSAAVNGLQGQNSTFLNYTAVGGGGGGGHAQSAPYMFITGINGGSGGGVADGTPAAGNGTAGQGFNGGNGSAAPPYTGGGGGGGAGGLGQNTPDNTNAGIGGLPLNNTINGSNVNYSKGGNGTGTGTWTGSAGAANTGNGGGGSRGADGGAGGSGVVIIKFLTSQPPIANLTFVSQTPNDINTTNIINGMNVTYNITGASLNSSTATLFTKVNSSLSECWQYINGTATCGFQPDGTPNITGDLYEWQMEHDFITPIVSPLSTMLFENATQSQNNLTATTEAVKVMFKNITNSTSFNILLFSANSTSNASLSLRIYYCNQSYVSGNYPADTNCAQFADFNGTTEFSFTEGTAKYNTVSVPVNTTAGTISGIKITPISYFIFRGRTGIADQWSWYSIPNISTGNTTQTTTNTGTAWTNFSGTMNIHLHQFVPNQTICYYPQINDTSGTPTNSSIRCDLLEQGNMPPSSPSVFSPINTSYYKDIGQNISINYTASVSPNSYPIVQYNITLRNATTDALVLVINGNNSPNLSYSWNASGVPDGQYNIHVRAWDSLNQTSFGESEDFTLLTTPPITNITFTSPNSGQYYLLNATVNLTFNATNFKNCTLEINGVNSTMTNVSATLCQYNFTDTVGNFSIVGYVNDLAGHTNQTANLSFQLFNITSATAIFSNPEYDLSPDNISVSIVTNNYYGAMSGNLTYNGSISAFTTSQTGSNFFLWKVQSPPNVVATETIPLVLNYTFTDALLDYSISTTTDLTDSGLFECGNNTNTTAFNITYLDEETGLSLLVNDSLQISYVDFAGRGVTFNSTNISYHPICIFPPNLSLNISIFVTANSPQHFQKTQTITLNVSNATTNITVFLTSSLTSAFYTFQTINVYSAPIAGSNITLERLNQVTNQYQVVQSGTTDITGSLSVPLQQFISYRMNITSLGYNFESFLIIPSTATTIQIILTQNTTTDITSLNAFNNVYYNITPAAGYYNTSKTLTFFVTSNNSNLESWGMFITVTNGSNVTKVFDQQSTTASGGTLSYVANPSQTYVVHAWFKAANNTNFSIAPVYYFINNQSVGLAWIRDQLANDNVVSGWTYYFIALAISIGIGIAINRLMGVGTSGAAIGALICLVFFSLLAPPNMVIFGILTPFMATVLIGAVTIAVIYLTHYGA